MDNTIFTTIHGSHLYGLNNNSSDVDHYVVVRDGSTIQSKKDSEDVLIIIITLDDFLTSVSKGVPQAVEALFSSKKVYQNSNWEPYINGLRPGNNLLTIYRRTIFNFAHRNGGRTGGALVTAKSSPYYQMKIKRHALRLCINLNEYVLYGMFNPTLSELDSSVISELVYDRNYLNIVDEALSRSLMGELDLARL